MMRKHGEAAPTTTIREEAALWVLRLHEATAEQQAQCQADCEAWQARDERHRQMFRQMQRMWQAVHPQPQRHAWRRRSVAALLLMLALGLGWQLPWAVWTADHRAATGELRRITLADGSRLVLDSGSAIDVHYDTQLRRIHVHRGEVWAQVAADRRPFRIESRDGSGTALGTRFSLRLLADHSELAVEESRVMAAAGPAAAQTLALQAGQTARLADGRVMAGADVTPAHFAWTQRQLVFTDRPLPEVVAALSRYRSGWLLMGDHAQLRTLRFTGVLPTDDSDAALAVLESTLPLRTQRLTPYLVWLQAVPG